MGWSQIDIEYEVKFLCPCGKYIRLLQPYAKIACECGKIYKLEEAPLIVEKD